MKLILLQTMLKMGGVCHKKRNVGEILARFDTERLWETAFLILGMQMQKIDPSHRKDIY
jgi:hypothetical protein